MAGYTVTKKNKVDINQILLSVSFVLLLSAIFIPLFLLIPIQAVLYSPEGYWMFEPSFSAYIVFISGIVSIAILFIIKVWSESREKHNRLIKYFTSIGIAISILFLLLSVDRYHYFDANGIHVNPLFGFKEIHYSWEEVERVEQTVKVRGGVMSHDKMVFHFSNGESYETLLNENARKALQAVLFKLKKQGVEIDRQ